jgi:putative membrane protein
MSNADPRVFFASERTLLAWMRTGIAIIGLGFVVAKFGLFIRLLASQGHAFVRESAYSTSALLGIAFVLIGSTCIVGAAIQHQRFTQTLPASDLPPRYSRRFAVVLSLLVAVLGVCLAIYLIGA